MTFRRINRGSYHSYEENGAKVPGVTTLIGDGCPKPALVEWAARSVAEWAGDNHDRLADLPPSSVTAQAVKAFRDGRGKALSHGTIAHTLAERLMRGDEIEVPDEMAGVVDTLLQWVRDYHVEPIAIEASVLHRAFHYAGTVDLIANVWGHLALIDYKTGKSGIFPEAALQLAAYANAEVYVDADGNERRMPLAPEEAPTAAKPEGTPRFELVAALWLQDDKYELVPVDAGRSTFTSFRYVAEVAKWAKRDRREIVLDPLSPFDALHLGAA